jgi:hypothetical protein
MEKVTECIKDNFIEVIINKKRLEEIKIIPKLKSFVKETSKIASFTCKNNEKKESYDSPIYGQIMEIEDSEESVKILIEKCAHETTYHYICINCGYNLKHKEENLHRNNNFISISNTLKFSVNKAKQEEEGILKNLILNKKLILLLDIDNTILHSAALVLKEEEKKILKEENGIYFYEFSLDNQNITAKFRPHLKEYLKYI